MRGSVRPKCPYSAHYERIVLSTRGRRRSRLDADAMTETQRMISALTNTANARRSAQIAASGPARRMPTLAPASLSRDNTGIGTSLA